MKLFAILSLVLYGLAKPAMAAPAASSAYDVVFDSDGKATVGKPGETIVSPEIFHQFVARDAGECFSVDTGSPKNMNWNDVDQFVVVDDKKCRPKLQLQNGTCHHHMDLGNRCSAFCQTSGFYYYAEPIDLMGGKMCRYGEGCELKREESYRVDISNTEVERHVFDAMMSLNPTATWGLGWKTVTIGGETIGGGGAPKTSSKPKAGGKPTAVKRDAAPETDEDHEPWTYQQNSLDNWRQEFEDEINGVPPPAPTLDPNEDYIGRVMEEMRRQGPLFPDPEHPVHNHQSPEWAPSFAQRGDGRRNAEAEAYLAKLREPYTWKDSFKTKANKFSDRVRDIFKKAPKYDHTRPDLDVARARLRKIDRHDRRERKKEARRQQKEKAAAGIPDSEREMPAGLPGTPGAAGGSAILDAMGHAVLGSYATVNRDAYNVDGTVDDDDVAADDDDYYGEYNMDGAADPAPGAKTAKAAAGPGFSLPKFTIPKVNVPVPTIKNPQFTVAASFSAHWTRDWTRTYHHSVERASFMSLTHKQIPGEGCGAFWAVPVAVAYCGWLSLPRVPHAVQERATHWLKTTDNTYNGAFKLGSWPGPDAHKPEIAAADPYPAPMWNVTAGRCPVNYHEMPYCQATPLVVPDRNGGPGQALQRTVWRPYDCETGALLPTHMQPREVREQINFDEFFKYHAIKDPRLYNPHLAWYPLDDGVSSHGGHHSQ